MSGTPRKKRGAPSLGTLAWLIARYRETTAWSSLSPTTAGNAIIYFCMSLRQRAPSHSPTSPLLRLWLGATDAPRHQFRPAISLTPCADFSAGRQRPRWSRPIRRSGIDNPPHKQGDGFPPWTEEHVAAYQARWPIGTRQRVWLDVLLYTGLRRGDAVRFGRQHVKDGIGTIKTEKSGFTLPVTIPILPILAETLAAGPCGDLTFIAGESGRPLKKESFGNLFRDACREAGVPGSAHGVRKIAATTAANNGATVAQLEALFGWTGGAMASLYTRSANRRRLSLDAASKLSNAERTSIPSPSDQVRAPERKTK